MHCESVHVHGLARAAMQRRQKTCGMSKWNGIAWARGSFGEDGMRSGNEVSDKDNVKDNGIA